MKKLLCLLVCLLTVVCLFACKDKRGGGSSDINEVNITLDLGGGSISGSTSFTAELWEDLIIPSPTKKGYNFSGWKCDGEYVNLKPFMLQKEEVTLVATWQPKSYTVLLDFSGGAIVESDVSISQKRVSATYAQSVNFPTPIKDGYDFTGWYYGEEKLNVSSWNLDVGDVVLKAGWEQSAYQVTFNFNGGTLVEGDASLTQTVIPAKFDRSVEFPVVEKVGHRFLGWAFEGGKVLTSNVWVYDIENPVLYAVFQPVEVNYLLETDGGVVENLSGTILYGSSTSKIKAITPVKIGYDFVGWTVDGSALGDAFNYAPKKDKSSVIIRATYSPKNYLLTLDAGSGTLGANETSVTVTFGVECAVPIPTPPSEYKFLGWEVKATHELVSSYSGKITWNYARNESLVARYVQNAYLNFVNYDGSVETVLLDDVIFDPEQYIPTVKEKPGYICSWELSHEEICSLTETSEINVLATPMSYTAVFKSDGTQVHIGVYTYDKEVTLPDGNTVLNEKNEILKKSGYVLLGWYVDGTDPANYLSGTMVWNIIGKKTLHAVWKPLTYRIIYDVSSIKADYSMRDKDGNMVTSVQQVTFNEEFTLFTLSARDNLISVKWLNGETEMEQSGTWTYKNDLTLVPEITYNPVKIEVNLNLNGGGGSTQVAFTLGKPFKEVSGIPFSPSGKKLVGYSYKGTRYSLTDLFLIVDYDGTPIKCLYEDYISFTINLDVGEGSGKSTAVIEYGQPLSSMQDLPVAPNGKKLVGFLYKGVEYNRNYVWDFASYDGSVFTAIYVDDSMDWSPSV